MGPCGAGRVAYAVDGNRPDALRASRRATCLRRAHQVPGYAAGAIHHPRKIRRGALRLAGRSATGEKPRPGSRLRAARRLAAAKDARDAASKRDFRLAPSFKLNMAMLLAVSIVVLPAFPPSVMGTLVVLFFCGAGCLVLWKSEWRRACEWIALTAASQACFLQLIQAGQESHLPQIYSLSALLRPDRVLFLGATALQVCI